MEAKNKTWIKMLVFICVLAIMMLVGDYCIRHWYRRGIVMEVAARRPSTTGSDTFYFVLREDRTLSVQRGSSRHFVFMWEEFMPPPFRRSLFDTVYETLVIQITEDEFDWLIELVNRLPEDGFRVTNLGLSTGIFEVYYNGAISRGTYPFPGWHGRWTITLNNVFNEVLSLVPYEMRPY